MTFLCLQVIEKFLKVICFLTICVRQSWVNQEEWGLLIWISSAREQTAQNLFSGSQHGQLCWALNCSLEHCSAGSIKPPSQPVGCTFWVHTLIFLGGSCSEVRCFLLLLWVSELVQTSAYVPLKWACYLSNWWRQFHSAVSMWTSAEYIVIFKDCLRCAEQHITPVRVCKQFWESQRQEWENNNGPNKVARVLD